MGLMIMKPVQELVDLINRVNMSKIKPEGVQFSNPDNTTSQDVTRIVIQPASGVIEYAGSKMIRYRRRDIAKFFLGVQQTHTATSRFNTTSADILKAVLAKYRIVADGMVNGNSNTTVNFRYGDTVMFNVELDNVNSMTWRGTLPVRVTLNEPPPYPTDVNAFWNGIMETTATAVLNLPYPDKGNLNNLAYYINGVKVTPVINTTTKTVTTKTTYPAGRYTVSIRATAAGPYDMVCTTTKLVELLAPWKIPIPASVLGLLGGVNTASRLSNNPLLRKVPANLFEHCGGLTAVDSWFEGCTMLQGIPVGLMDPLVQVKSATKMFKDCQTITVVPNRFVAKAVLLLNVDAMFRGCNALKKENVPANPFEGTLVPGLAPGLLTGVFDWQ